MSDGEFVKVSLPYFKKKLWTLHDGCCLIAKVNPLNHSGVGIGYEAWTEDDPDSETDYTRRPFIAAIRSILAKSETELFESEQPKLIAHHIEDPMLSGKSVLVDATVFVSWVLKRWPDQSTHFKRAWEARQERKANSIDSFLSSASKTRTAQRNKKRRTAFAQLIKDLGPDSVNASDRDLAAALAKRIKDEPFKAKAETLRKLLRKWRQEPGG